MDRRDAGRILVVDDIPENVRCWMLCLRGRHSAGTDGIRAVRFV